MCPFRKMLLPEKGTCEIVGLEVSVPDQIDKSPLALNNVLLLIS